MGRITETVKVLLTINIIFFVGSYFLDNRATELFALWFPENENFRFWQIITHMFMHGGFIHIFFNMFLLYIFGSLLENYLGQARFLFLYFSAGLGAAGLQILFTYFSFNSAYQAFLEAGASPEQIQQVLHGVRFISSTQIEYHLIPTVGEENTLKLIGTYWSPMVGASGAIFGILAAFAFIYPNVPLYLMFIPIPIKAKWLIGAYFVLSVFSAVTGIPILGPENTAHWAHIGGAIIGFICIYYWKKDQFRQNRWD
ncbi:MAG TPA: rhomboid family intramembrane serine protease [Flavobacteriaceae bacterium]|nr:rhomboid family intramembrane serine protease [Flavobacteriaceae bacterium]